MKVRSPEVDARTVRFTLQGAGKTFTYSVTASSTAGDYDFSGVLRDSDRQDRPVGGDPTVTVEAPAGPQASATRSFDKTTVEPDGEVVVTIAATGYGSLGAVTETLPVGFSYTSSSLTDEGEVTEVDARTVRFTLQGADKTFTYTVTASSVERSHTFSGVLRDSERNDHTVGGATRVTVRAPRPVPPPSPPAKQASRVQQPGGGQRGGEHHHGGDGEGDGQRQPGHRHRLCHQRRFGTSASSPIAAATGELSFTTAPDFENPADAGANNEYVVTVRATSGAGVRAMTATQTILVTVTDVVEGPRAQPARRGRQRGD